MSDTLSFAELEEQHVELLPARTVLSLFSISVKQPPDCDSFFNCFSGGGTQSNTTGFGGFNFGNMTFGGTQVNSAGVGTPGADGSP